jgi:predicted RNA binding protein YcfA (HicA-like mRNA interferase family)
MSINYAVFRSLTAREIISALIRDGFYLRPGKGGHQRFNHADGRRVTVTFHKPSETFAPKTLKSMIDQARWTEDDLKRLGLLS